MKNIIKRLAVCSLATILSVGTLVGCGTTNIEGEKENTSQTQLYVSHYLGGVGNVWLNKNKEEFEKLYADYEGTDGKVGVQIMINDHKSTGDSLAEDLKNNKDEVFFTDKSKYYDTISQGALLDLTSVVTEKDASGVSLEDRLTEQQKGYYKYNDKYYALPHYESFGGLIYNRNLFNKKSLFFAKGGVPSEFSEFTQANNANPATGTAPATKDDYKYTNLNGEKSAGPDGKYGTSDDGLPATYEEFFVLCEYMAYKKQVTPFIWSGRFGKAYIEYLLNALWADVDGKEAVAAGYSFSGNNVNVVKSINSDGTLALESTTITDDNAYLTYQTEGMYRAFEFAIKMLSDPSYYAANIEKGNSHSHTDAQREFVLSEFEPTKWNGGKNIAMLIEGNYWENEARDFGIFDELPGGKTTADVSYAHMPIPKVDESRIGTKNVIVEKQGNISFIRANVDADKKQLAIDFLKFCYSAEKLKEFTEITGITRGLSYDMGEKKGDGMTDYAKSVVEYKEKADMVYLVSGNPLYTRNQTWFTFRFAVPETNYVLDVLMDKAGQITAQEVFNKVKSYRTEALWKSAVLGVN